MTVFSLPSPYLPISDNEAVDETYKNVAKFLSDDRDFTEETWEDMEQEEFIQEFLGQMKRKYQGYDLSLFKLNLVVRLDGREKVERIDFIELRVNSIDAPCSLHQASRVPGNVVVNYNIGTI